MAWQADKSGQTKASLLALISEGGSISMIRVADYVMKRISEEGVEHVFYVPGTQCVYLLDAIRRNKDLEGVAMHHEQAASMAAAYVLRRQTADICL